MITALEIFSAVRRRDLSFANLGLSIAILSNQGSYFLALYAMPLIIISTVTFVLGKYIFFSFRISFIKIDNEIFLRVQR